MWISREEYYYLKSAFMKYREKVSEERFDDDRVQKLSKTITEQSAEIDKYKKLYLDEFQKKDLN